jgi:hypothetical protein
MRVAHRRVLSIRSRICRALRVSRAATCNMRYRNAWISQRASSGVACHEHGAGLLGFLQAHGTTWIASHGTGLDGGRRQGRARCSSSASMRAWVPAFSPRARRAASQTLVCLREDTSGATCGQRGRTGEGASTFQHRTCSRNPQATSADDAPSTTAATAAC